MNRNLKPSIKPGLKMILGVSLVVALAGCANDRPRLGDAVRDMAEGQAYDPTAPHDDAGGYDGQKAARALETYRAPRQATTKNATPAVVFPTP